MVLLALAVKTATDALRSRHDAATPRAADGRMSTPAGAFFALLGLTLLNPATTVEHLRLFEHGKHASGVARVAGVQQQGGHVRR